MGITVKQSAVFFFRFDILVLKCCVFNGNADAVTDQLKDVFILLGEMPRFSAAHLNNTQHFAFLAADRDIGQRK